MKSLSFVVFGALVSVAGCSVSTSDATDVYVPENHQLYAAPGQVMINGGTRATADHIDPNHPFVKDYVLHRPVRSSYDSTVQVTVGSRIADQVDLFDVPSTGYAYTMINGKTVLVDPQRRRIVKVYTDR